MIIKAGNTGPNVRSDCFVQWEEKNSGGIDVNIKSKVGVLYGESIQELCVEVFRYFGIEHAWVEIVDKGALPWVMAARLEAAIKKSLKTDKEYLPEAMDALVFDEKDFRITRLYVPGNTPSMMLNAGLHKADGIILDLEDAVAPAKKNEARILVRNALRVCNFYSSERMVRINQGERGLADLAYVIPHGVNHIIVPKVESAESLLKVEQAIEDLKAQHGISYPIYIMPIIETALGVEHAFDIASSSKLILSMAIGLEDYTADIGVQRTREGQESLFARNRVVNACHAAKILPLDSVFSDISDMEGLLQNVKASKSIGFKGLGCIHPSQIAVIKKGFAPNEKEIERAKQVVYAAQKAERAGLGVVALGSKMIDAPVVKRHKLNIDLAIKLGLLKEGWEAFMEVKN